MGALGCTQRTRGRRRVGSALEWQGGRRVSAHVQPARNFQGVSSAPGSAQHEQSVQDVSFASGRRPQLQRLGACTESCTVQNTSLVFEQRAQRACTQITTRAAHAHDLEAELIQVGGWDSSSDSEGCRSSEGSDFESKNEGEGCSGPEGSDLAAEEGCCAMLRSGGE